MDFDLVGSVGYVFVDGDVAAVVDLGNRQMVYTLASIRSFGGRKQLTTDRGSKPYLLCGPIVAASS